MITPVLLLSALTTPAAPSMLVSCPLHDQPEDALIIKIENDKLLVKTSAKNARYEYGYILDLKNTDRRILLGNDVFIANGSARMQNKFNRHTTVRYIFDKDFVEILSAELSQDGTLVDANKTRF